MKKMIGIVLLVSMMLFLLSACAQTEQPDEPETAKPEVVVDEAAELERKKLEMIETFDTIKIGTTYAEACESLGQEGNAEVQLSCFATLWESDIAHGETRYFWPLDNNNENPLNLYGFFMSFENNKLVSKVTYNLDNIQDIPVQDITYNDVLKFELGISLSQAFKLLDKTPYLYREITTADHILKEYHVVNASGNGFYGDSKYLHLAFMDDILVGIFHSGLAEPAQVKESKCNSIPLGITYEKLCELLGSKGILLFDYIEGNQQDTTFIWQVENSEFGIVPYAFSFSNGVLDNKWLELAI